MTAGIVLISERPQLVEQFAKPLANALATTHSSYRTIEEVQLDPVHDSPMAIIFDAEGVEIDKCLNSTIGANLNPNQTFLLIGQKDTNSLGQVFKHPYIGGLIVNRRGVVSEADALQFARIARVASLKDVFGLEKFMTSEAVIESMSITNSDQKGLAASATVTFLDSVGCNDRLVSNVATALDELLMNAIFDAPIDSDGNRIHQRLSRSTALESNGVTVQIGTEMDFIAVSVRDSVGSLVRSDILRHIGLNYQVESSGHRDPTLAGSGLGLTLTMRAGGSLFFACVPNKYTEVTAIFRRSQSHRASRSDAIFLATWINSKA